MRDITLEDTFRHQFTTRQFSDGVPTTLSGTPVLSVLEENNATPITAGVSVSVDRATVTGLNEATIVATAANGYESGKSYAIYISTGTVGGTSVVGEVVGHFTIQASAAAADLANGTDGLGAIKAETALIVADTNELQSDWTNTGRLDTILDTVAADVVNIDGAAMRGTDNAALASVLGALADVAAAGDPTSADTVMQYIKQLVNVLVGTAGVTTWAAGAAPGNGVSISEALRAVYDDTNDIQPKIGTPAADLSADIAANATPAEVLTQVNAALDTAISELAQAQPTATPTLRTGLMLLYMALRNRLDVQTSGTDALEIHNAAGTLIAKKLLTDAGGDYSEALIVSGP